MSETPAARLKRRIEESGDETEILILVATALTEHLFAHDEADRRVRECLIETRS